MAWRHVANVLFTGAIPGLVLGAVLVLGGCASQPAAKSPVAAAAGVPLQTVSAARLKRYLRNQSAALAHSLAAAEQAGMVAAPVTGTGQLTIRLAAGRWFDAHSGQLRVAALAYGAQLGAVLAARPAQVVWVVGRGARDGAIYSLSARRAASLAATLRRHGVPARRLRVITRGGSGHGAAVLDIVIKPLETGQIARAYMPPD